MAWEEVKAPNERTPKEIDAEKKALQEQNRVEVEVEQEAPTKPAAKDDTPAKATSAVDLEIEDDTPEADRNRKRPSNPPKDPTDEELANYNEKAAQRIKHFTRSYHDERVAKEAALRERGAAAELARKALEHAKKLEAELKTLREQSTTTSKSAAELRLESARAKYKDAYEAGDADALTKAQEELVEARLSAKDAEKPVTGTEFAADTLQADFDEVYSKQDVPATQARRTPDEAAIAWTSKNPWFNQDPSMTRFAMEEHAKVVFENKFQVNSPEYYQHIDKRMRQAYPDYDWGDDDATVNPPAEDRRADKRPATVVAGAERSTPTRKIKLTASEVRLANRLGITPEQYAQQKAALGG